MVSKAELIAELEKLREKVKGFMFEEKAELFKDIESLKVKIAAFVEKL